jgi:hypothetical protein
MTVAVFLSDFFWHEHFTIKLTDPAIFSGLGVPCFLSRRVFTFTLKEFIFSVSHIYPHALIVMETAKWGFRTNRVTDKPGDKPGDRRPDPD